MGANLSPAPMLSDLRFALRQLCKTPLFSLVAILTLAVGVGSVTGFFSLFNALILNPLPYPEADRLVQVWSNHGQPFSAPDFFDMRDEAKSFSEFGAYQTGRFTLGDGNPETVTGIRCTASALRSFGIQPAAGRWFSETDEKPGAPKVAILSHGLWKRRFGGDPGIVGKTAILDGEETVVAGIMPARFDFQSPWFRGREFELWTPLALTRDGENRGSHWLCCVGRLKPEVSLEQADADVKTVGKRLAAAYPKSNSRKPFLVVPLNVEMTRRSSDGMWTLLGAVLLVLLVACCNVASMLLARGTHRVSEFGVRLALGASPGQIRRLLLAESSLLGLGGCALGILLAWGGVALLRSLLLLSEGRRTAIQIDWSMMLFAVGLALLTSLLFGLAPALSASRTSVAEAAREGAKSGGSSPGRFRFLGGLVTGQIAVALVLVNSAALLVMCYARVLENNRALDTDEVITAWVSLSTPSYVSEESKIRFWPRFVERVQSLPGVKAAGITNKIPLEGGNNREVLVDNQIYDHTISRPLSEVSRVSPGYFDAMGLRILQGRGPLEGDYGDVLKIVVNRTFAEKFWPGQNAVGHRVRDDSDSSVFTAEIVGVVEDIRQQSAERPPMPEMYFPRGGENVSGSAHIVVRTSADARPLGSLLRAELAAMDPALSLYNLRTMRDVVGDNTRSRRFLTVLIATFMITALGLAGVGVYGTISYQVLRRTREIGVRMALGALHRNVIALVYRQTLPWLLFGTLAGVALSFCAAQAFRSIITGVSPFNPLYSAASVLFVAGAVALACWMPAFRATRVQPSEALRHD